MTNKSMLSWQENSYLYDGSSDYLESLFDLYLSSPAEVAPEWRTYFESLPQKNGHIDISHETVRRYFKTLVASPARYSNASLASSGEVGKEHKQARVMDLINAYRRNGHRQADINPLQVVPPEVEPELTLPYHELSAEDLKSVFSAGNLGEGDTHKSLQEILDFLQKTYCGKIGIEYKHMTRSVEAKWLQERMEAVQGQPNFSDKIKKHLLTLLLRAEGLEKYLGSRFVGQKRFSLEGGESFLASLDGIINRSGEQEIQDIVIGMAHRGRLNVLVNLLGKSPAELISEFEGKKAESELSGDVKYHMGFSADIVTLCGHPVHLSLAFNPSHLEIVNPVVVGSVRSRQDRRTESERFQKVLPILVHGDAAFAGQGVNMELLNMSQTNGYGTGGTIHIIINNQVGFTTSDPKDARSTRYCSDLMKMLEAPVFHVNGDDVEAVLFVTQLAFDYRMKFNRDVLIDLICYRRHGHNEADEPMITQPLMYQFIKAHETTYQSYAKVLIDKNLITKTDLDNELAQYRQALDDGRQVVTPFKNPDNRWAINFDAYLGKTWRAECDTRLPLKNLQNLAKKINTIPEGFLLQAQVDKEIKSRLQMAEGELPMNWGFCENLAYASLLAESHHIRLSGQDVGRGTFTHRHAVLHDQQADRVYLPLQHIETTQGNIEVINSLLSEEAVLGFEYGYACSSPDYLVLWEAQFGDFANGAQVIVDQFLSSGEQKWGRLCGLTMLLPHGYEGMGPEHSSARVERYLQLCAQENMQVCIPSTPAQAYHLLLCLMRHWLYCQLFYPRQQQRYQ